MERSKKVLIVEDDNSIRDILTEALTDSNYEVEAIADTKDIFHDIERVKPDIVLIDYLLPQVNGGEICYQIKNNPRTKSLPVFMLSAYPKLINSLGNYGWDKLIEKPFNLWELIDGIDEILKKSALLDRNHNKH